jgi:hypothetical protein
MTATAHPWWVSWHEAGAFEYHGPWWVSGYAVEFDPDHPSKGVTAGKPMFCAAVMADDEDQVIETIAAAHDERPGIIEWRFIDEKEPGWQPFSDRFPLADWMIWP